MRYLYGVLRSIPMWEGSPYTTPSSSHIPAGCPEILLNSDVICLEIASDSTSLGLNLIKPSPLHFRRQSQAQVITYTSYRLVINQRFSRTARAAHGAPDSVYSPGYQFIIKGYNSGTTRWKRCIGQCKKKGEELSCPLSRCTILPNHCMCINPEVLQTQPFWFLWRLHYIIRIYQSQPQVLPKVLINITKDTFIT